MKIFIIGLPQSGRTKVAQALAEEPGYHYVSGHDWLESTFRPPRALEKLEDYEKDYFNFYINRLKIDPYVTVDSVYDSMDAAGRNNNFVIDGINNPRDLIHLLDYNTDVAVFLNRTDSVATPKDHEGVAVNVMRDYCLYLAATGLLPKTRWLEYNFKIPGEESDTIKQLGRHNTVTITKSINKAIEHLKGELWNLLREEAT